MKTFYTIASLACIFLCATRTMAQFTYPDCQYGEELTSKAAKFLPGLGGAGMPDDTRGAICFAETNSQWYRFRCTASGSFEFMVSPTGAGANYDFALMKECPCSGNPQVMFCNNRTPTNAPKFGETGLSSNAPGTFGVGWTFEWTIATAKFSGRPKLLLVTQQYLWKWGRISSTICGTAQIGQIQPQQNLISTMIGPPDLLCPDDALDKYFKVSTPGSFGTDLIYNWEVTPGQTGQFLIADIKGYFGYVAQIRKTKSILIFCSPIQLIL